MVTRFESRSAGLHWSEMELPVFHRPLAMEALAGEVVRVTERE